MDMWLMGGGAGREEGTRRSGWGRDRLGKGEGRGKGGGRPGIIIWIIAIQMAIWEMPDLMVIQMPMCQITIQMAIWQMPNKRGIK